MAPHLSYIWFFRRNHLTFIAESFYKFIKAIYLYSVWIGKAIQLNTLPSQLQLSYLICFKSHILIYLMFLLHGSKKNYKTCKFQPTCMYHLMQC